MAAVEELVLLVETELLAAVAQAMAATEVAAQRLLLVEPLQLMLVVVAEVLDLMEVLLAQAELVVEQMDLSTQYQQPQQLIPAVVVEALERNQQMAAQAVQVSLS